MGIPFPEIQGREYTQDGKTAKEELLSRSQDRFSNSTVRDFPKFQKLSGNPVDVGGEIPGIG
jgi:hypothetical protein